MKVPTGQLTRHAYMDLDDHEMMNLLRYLYDKAGAIEKSYLIELLVNLRGGDEYTQARILSGRVFGKSNPRKFEAIMLRRAIDLLRSPDMFGEFHFNDFYEKFVDNELTPYRNGEKKEKLKAVQTVVARARYKATTTPAKKLEAQMQRIRTQTN